MLHLIPVGRSINGYHCPNLDSTTTCYNISAHSMANGREILARLLGTAKGCAIVHHLITTMPPKLNLIPPLSQLPLNEGDPPHSAWGLWEGHDSSLGSLNYLTDELVLKTLREEVRTGVRIGLE